MPVNLKGRSFLTLMDFTPEEIAYLLSLSADLKAKKRAGIRGCALAGKNVALLFEKASTRTRCAFTVACIDEGGHPEFLGKNDIHLGGKEDVKDTARVLGRMFDGIEFRGFRQSMVEELARWAGVPVWNGLTDVDHPTQVLADFLTLQENFGRLEGLNLTYVGDGRNNMANALMIGSAKMGVNFTIGSPRELFPDPELVERCRAAAQRSGAEIRIVDDPRRAVEGADAVYTDVWVSMGEEAQKETRVRLLTPWQVNGDLMRATGRERTIFLHCLPAVKGCEVTEEVFESPCSKVFDEAENRMHTIKAVMVATIGA
ncbi:ornithine carbamoyltransferase [uncultured Fretibacterium sp.]|uniref:ornithine carbamoyltransferase n=1 Tax=uncultured Fretibacterium sp. TaxID=1678694 RepID=UPI00325FAF52